jgi:polyvinyl alcohol dehydrogenase (cytochrome)
MNSMLKRTLPVIALFALALAAGTSQAATTGAATTPADAPKAGAGDNAPRFDNKATAAEHPGEPLFKLYCASCHLGQVAKAPHLMFLQMMAPDAIYGALDVGIMRSHAEKLSQEQKQQVATYLGGDHPLSTLRAPQCTGDAAKFDASRKPSASGWGLTPENTRHIRADDAQITAADLPRLELKWAFAFPNAQRARSQPAIAYGAVYIGSQDGTVYALDEETGCVRWTFRAPAEVRTAVIVESPSAAGKHAGSPLVFFGDLLARVYAVDAFTGQLRWSYKADDHPNATITGAPSLHDGTLYVPVSSLEVTSAADPAYECCTFRGSVLALDARTGTSRWKAFTIPTAPREVGRTRVGTRILAPSGAPVWNSPAIDAPRGMLYVGTGENYSSPANDTSDALIAFRLQDGAMVWHAQKTANDAWNVACMLPDNPNCPKENGPDVDFGASTIVLRDAKRGDLLLAGQKSGWVYGVNPDARGKIVWSSKVGRGGIQGGVHFGMATDGQRLFVPISDMKDEHDGRKHDAPSRAGIYALDPRTGTELWAAPADDTCAGRQFCDPGISATVTSIPGAVLAGHMDGRLRAYDAATGKVVWEVDATQEWKTVSGEVARGGSFGGGAGPMVVNGKVFAASGYGLYFHMPGNVLLVFAPHAP